MKIIKIVLMFVILFGNLTYLWSMEKKEETATIESETTIYLKNCSKYDVRIEVGPEYPNAISLLPQQIIEFPLKKMATIVASSYGKYAFCKSGVPHNQTVTDLLKKNPEYSTKDCLITINFEEDQGLISTYIITQGKWSLGLQPVNAETDLSGYYCDGSYSKELYKVIAQTSGSQSEDLTEQAALVWSMFPRAASKLAIGQGIYPFHILGLDVGGDIPTDAQMENWHGLLINSLRKKYRTIDNPDIWNAVNMIIAGSIASYKRHHYYENLDPNSPSSYLKSLKTSSATTLPLFPVPKELIQELKEWIGENKRAQAIVQQIENRLCEKNSNPQESTIPQPPPPPPLNKARAGSCHEKVVSDFIREVNAKQPEEQVLLDKVAFSVFNTIDGGCFAKGVATRLKYGALSQLRTIDQNVKKNPITSLTKIMEFTTPAMIRLAHNDANPLRAVQEWLDFLARADREKCSDCAKKDGEPLLQAFMAEKRANDSQLTLILELKKQFDRYHQPD